ncbi:chloride channel protein [Flavobacterium sp. I3-2]|uniref:chloride channel protein n=1 Tax=Flavobacterium sp. I3-2 TaxID=2748319 RepID=UPI0015B32DC6|nr:chloride channel protein [Flavobacterium sp. I3-2]
MKLNLYKSGFYKNLKWVLLLSFLALVVELSVHFFLFSLNAVTEYRLQNQYLVYFLPIAGFLIGYVYYIFGKSSEGGNNLLIDAYYSSLKRIPLISTPLVYFGTIATHLFGGSAGREGAGLQIAGGYVDFLIRLFRFSEKERHILIKVAVGAGFSAVFGTPFTAVFFSFEFFNIGKPNFKGALSIIYVAFLVEFISNLLGLEHTFYDVKQIPTFEFKYLFYLIVAGVCFGLSARLFNFSLTHIHKYFAKFIPHLPYRLFVGGIIIVMLTLILGTNTYLGIGINTILSAFDHAQGFEVFLFKIIFTSITLGSGFKGGEVTPLFFVGATLGSFLATFLPLPIGFLTALGFVSVFSGAANTPIACMILAVELFGFEIFPYAFITCVISYFISGYTSIFNKQKVTNFKLFKRPEFLGKRISEL